MEEVKLSEKPSRRVELALTLPIFVLYHLGVIFLRVHNAMDFVTFQLFHEVGDNKGLYLLFTLAIGTVFTGLFAWLGRGEAFRTWKFVQIALEGIVYAYVIKLASSFVVGHMVLGPAQPAEKMSAFEGVVMSCGAGFYEELAFRVLLYGGGAWLIGWIMIDRATPPTASVKMRVFFARAAWALVAAGVFSFTHYTGALGDKFDVRSFVFRWVCGLCLTAIYAARGFAAGVWAHAVYDVEVLVF